VLIGTARRASPEYRQHVVLIIAGVITAVAVIVWLSRWTHRESRELGSVSGNWLAEYRQNHES
jgi:hypothetical protein